MSKTRKKFPPEVRERAVRMVLEHEQDHPSRWAAMMSTAEKIGCTAQTLSEWVKKAKVDSGKRAGVATDGAERLKALVRENGDPCCNADGSDAAPAERLNRGCFCRTLDPAALEGALERSRGVGRDLRDLLRERPHLLSATPVFISADDVMALEAVVGAIERAAALPAYRNAVLAWAPAIAHCDFGPRGVMMGYDFHLTAEGPRLIEVNTNAGGAFLNARVADAHRICCAGAGAGFPPGDPQAFDAAVLTMFETEWRLQRGSGAAGRIAIVDDMPQAQHLYPEFLLAKDLLQASADVIICDPQALSFEAGELRAEGDRIDLVYNRLVDFALEAPEHAALRAAYEAGAVVLTPNPHVHALFADKRDLVLLSDRERLAAWGLSPADVAALAAVPKTLPVTPKTADVFWADRKSWFFKPTRGHASRGVYRGDKLTRRVWTEIVGADYVAQALAPPSERMVDVDGRPEPRKLDVRLYTYQGQVLMAAARLYQGQATNMRTPGGGFAPLLVI